ncbi:MAG: Lrp/AsnC family transcriptional regulator [Anaerolineales bacterium]|nr:Lrp/AsnC family transcriptional regulator [Anaerolineales bacterium]MDP7345877.1 Lrp/AsnC family transcriptional regulator [Anaerolineales bacterium]MDP7644176.1 Lrp/AsnC family transcriptional regulator [Anaerolineales bacterium]HJL70994.1 Lrp/AsnC family transcriptional regulator [Anaerolineales bacterium]HJN40990.1 Lrp/AsnC family transcriptional regulator [Anaerolineales bacterium]|tara:strand:- start:412 stop:768 length:357 start_codon:yes stop_codon:yes gene_type:complete
MASTSNSMVDELDLSILAHLRDHGRKSFTANAGLLDVSVGTARNRIERMLSHDTLNIVERVAGEFDLSVDVMCRENSHLTELVTERLQRISGVRRTSTMVILHECKYGQADLICCAQP